MRIDEFSEEFTKLYKYFKDKEPDSEKILEYHELLRFMPFEKFKQICKTIKEYEDKLPVNLVAYCNNLRREAGEKATGGNKPPDLQEKIECAACQDTGFIAIIATIDPDTGRKIRKVKEPGEIGLDFAFRCLCSKGQQLSQEIPFAKEEEVKQSAIMNGSNKAFVPKKQKQKPSYAIDFEEAPF